MIMINYNTRQCILQSCTIITLMVVFPQPAFPTILLSSPSFARCDNSSLLTNCTNQILMQATINLTAETQPLSATTTIRCIDRSACGWARIVSHPTHTLIHPQPQHTVQHWSVHVPVIMPLMMGVHAEMLHQIPWSTLQFGQPPPLPCCTTFHMQGCIMANPKRCDCCGGYGGCCCGVTTHPRTRRNPPHPHPPWNYLPKSNKQLTPKQQQWQQRRQATQHTKQRISPRRWSITPRRWGSCLTCHL